MTTYYIDPLVGSDGNAGTSPGAGNALASIAAASGKAGTGHTYYLQDAYHVQTGIGSICASVGFAKSDSLWLPYPFAANRPVIDGLAFLAPNDSGWLYVGNGIWSKNCAVGGTVQEVDRLFINSRANNQTNTGRTVGDAYIKGFSRDGLNSKQIWWSEPTQADRLYVYTGSATQTPPEYYQGLAIVQRGNNASPLGFRFRNCNNFRMEFVDLRGMNTICIGSDTPNTGPTTNAELYNLRITHTGYRGISLKGALGQEVIGCTVSNLYATDSASIYEKEEVAETHYGGYELVEFTGYTRNCTLENFECTIGHGHGTLAFTCDDLDVASVNNVARNGKCTSQQWTKDTRGWASRHTTNCLLQNVVFSGYDEASHIEGNGMVMEDCVWKDLRRNRQVAGDGLSPIDLSITAVAEVNNVIVRRCVFDLRGDNDILAVYKIQIRVNGSTLAANGVQFYDNVLFMRAGQAITLQNKSPGATISANQSVYNNIVITPNISDAVYNIDGGNNYDVVTYYSINAFWTAGGGAVGAVNNVQHTKVTAMIDDASYRINNVASPLRGTAAFTSYKRDVDGNSMNNPPDKGARAYRSPGI